MALAYAFTNMEMTAKQLRFGPIHPDLSVTIANAIRHRTRGIEAALLYGSVARRMTDSFSDIDLILVTGNRRRSPIALKRLVADLQATDRLQVQALTRSDLKELFRDRPDFATHLVTEGIVIFDARGFLADLLSRPLRSITSQDFQKVISEARRQDRMDRFNGQLLFCLARLYVLGKAAVMLSLVKHGQAVFDRRLAFSSFKRMHSDLAVAADSIARLEPFYLKARRGSSVRLPFDPSGAQAPSAARLAILSVGQIAARG